MTKQSQCELVLNRLKAGPATMWDLTVGLRILRPGARIFELRKQGHEITSTEHNVNGKRVVTYRLSTTPNAPLPIPDLGTPKNAGSGSFSGLCLECGKPFRKKQQAIFCRSACRTAYWKRKNQQPALFTDLQRISTEVV